MTYCIMKEWLLWFNNRMRCVYKTVLLSIDKFIAYELKVEQVVKKGELTHTKVRSFDIGRH